MPSCSPARKTSSARSSLRSNYRLLVAVACRLVLRGSAYQGFRGYDPAGGDGGWHPVACSSLSIRYPGGSVVGQFGRARNELRRNLRSGTGVIQNTMRLHVLAGIVVSGLNVVPAAEAKVVPRLDKTLAAPGDQVVIQFGSGVSQYLAPLEVDLVRTAVEPTITGRNDRRLRSVGRLGRAGEMITQTRLRFRVPSLSAGRYTLAVWFKGTVTNRWNNLAQGLWRDPTFRDRLLLRIVRRPS